MWRAIFTREIRKDQACDTFARIRLASRDYRCGLRGSQPGRRVMQHKGELAETPIAFCLTTIVHAEQTRQERQDDGERFNRTSRRNFLSAQLRLTKTKAAQQQLVRQHQFVSLCEASSRSIDGFSILQSWKLCNNNRRLHQHAWSFAIDS